MAFDETDRMRAAAAREWMRRVSSLESRARSMRGAIEQARALMLPKGMSLEGGSSAGAYADAIPDGIAKLDAMVADYEAHLSALVDEERQAGHSVARLGAAPGGARGALSPRGELRADSGAHGLQPGGREEAPSRRARAALRPHASGAQKDPRSGLTAKSSHN